MGTMQFSEKCDSGRDVRAGRVATMQAMEITLLAFAQARQQFGFASRVVACDAGDTALAVVQREVPWAKLEGMRAALDGEYVAWDAPVGAAKELAVLPPVSGG